MKKSKTFGQILDILTKILGAFIIVFLLYFIGKIINTFAYNYFIFPFASVIIVFVCGINVGKSLEKIKHREAIGVFSKERKKNYKDIGKTEFVVRDRRQILTNKKILKELEDGEIVHVKNYQYNGDNGQNQLKK